MEFEAKQVDLREYWRVVFKHRWTIGVAFAVIVLSVLIFSFTATPIYEAKTRIVIEKENPKVVSIQEVMTIDSSGLDYYQTQYKIIESRAVAREVIKRLQLDKNPDFNPPPSAAGFFSMVWETVTYPIWFVGTLLKTDKTKQELAEKEENADGPLVSRFLRGLKVSPIRNSRLVDISYEHKNPALATKIVNTLAKAYIDLNLDTKLKATQDAVAWLNSRIDEERKKVDMAEQNLLRYKERHGIITDFSSNAETITAQKLASLNQQVSEAEAKRVEAETRYRQAAALEKNPEMMDSIPEVMNDQLIRQMKTIEVDVYKRMSELSKKYGQNHPQIIALQNELDTLQARKIKEIRRIIELLHNEYRVAQARERSLKDNLGRQKEETLSMNQKAIDYTVLKREAESSKEMYDLLIKRFKEASLTEDIRTGNIRIVDLAEVPKAPVKPKKTQNFLLSLIVGLALGVGLAFFLEYLDNTIKTPDDVKHHLKLTYLGPIPLIVSEKKESDDTTPEKRQPGEDLVTLISPKSTASESYRGIRTSILFSSPDQSPQVLLITSAGPREGKTITAANLAITMAQAGGRVLILDCDMRRPRVHKVFNTTRDRGMSNILVGRCDVNDAIVHSPISNVDIIPSGPIPPNPSEMLGSHHMRQLIEQLRGRYERIIIDSPPTSAVTDAVILSQVVDGVIVVIRSGVTHRELVKNALNMLHAVNARILGVILNGVDTGRDSYYYYQYYYYYYGEDGERRKKTRKKRKHRGPYGDDSRAASA